MGTLPRLPLILEWRQCPTITRVTMMTLTTRKGRELRVPTLDDLAAYDGAHTFKLWRSLPSDWLCPSCKRTRYQLLTWTKALTPSTRRLRGEVNWLAAIHGHHDHGSHGGRQRRFPFTLICQECNATDGKAKRMLGLPPDFSFSPEELGMFVVGRPHAGVTADFTIARQIYDRLSRS
jgi:hypothetical protein